MHCKLTAFEVRNVAFGTVKGMLLQKKRNICRIL